MLVVHNGDASFDGEILFILCHCIVSDFRKQRTLRRQNRYESKEKGKEGALNKGSETKIVQPFW